MKFLNISNKLEVSKILQLVACLSLSLLFLTACGQDKQTKTVSSPKVEKQVQSKKRPKLSAKKDKDTTFNVGPKKTVAIITIYAAKKYGGTWQKTFAQNKEGGFYAVIKNSEYFPHISSKFGVVYQVGYYGDVYTLKQVGEDNLVYLYANNGLQFLGQATISDMSKYLKENNWDDLVGKYLHKTRIEDLRISPSLMNKKVEGDIGPCFMPVNMRGNWYSYFDKRINTITIGTDYIEENGEKYELHQIDGKFFNYKSYEDMSKNYHTRTQNWRMADKNDRKIHGIKWVRLRTWMQGAGSSLYLGLHSEKGQPVLVEASSLYVSVNQVYWKTPQLAMQYKDRKFKDLYYSK